MALFERVNGVKLLVKLFGFVFQFDLVFTRGVCFVNQVCKVFHLTNLFCRCISAHLLDGIPHFGLFAAILEALVKSFQFCAFPFQRFFCRIFLGCFSSLSTLTVVTAIVFQLDISGGLLCR
ncbi:hypothetical protein BvCmsSIP019_01636 [Escherichia coli]|nr:hypothetical protein BvCmsSIP019_01636 [Escherichia coli]